MSIQTGTYRSMDEQKWLMIELVCRQVDFYIDRTAYFAICCVVINRCSHRYTSFLRLAERQNIRHALLQKSTCRHTRRCRKTV